MNVLHSWLFCILSAATPLRAATPMLYVHNGPEGPLDRRYDYHWEILQGALERTVDSYGPFEIRPSVFMTEGRQRIELGRSSGRISVMFQGTTQEMEDALIPARIPVDRDLSGYFVLLIHGDRQPDFSRIRNLQDLKKFKVGLGKDWLDNKVYAHSGFRVVTGTNYDGLFEMVVNNRFDIFPRSAVEVFSELDSREKSSPQLKLEKTVLLHYTWPMYFWFSNTPEGKRMATRAQDGMERMLSDGSFLRIFQKYFQTNIDRLDLPNRVLIDLPNPLLPKETPLADKRLWFRPFK